MHTYVYMYTVVHKFGAPSDLRAKRERANREYACTLIELDSKIVIVCSPRTCSKIDRFNPLLDNERQIFQRQCIHTGCLFRLDAVECLASNRWYRRKQFLLLERIFCIFSVPREIFHRVGMKQAPYIYALVELWKEDHRCNFGKYFFEYLFFPFYQSLTSLSLVERYRVARPIVSR